MSSERLTSEQRQLKNSFEFHLTDLLTKFDAEMYVDEDDDQITVIIPEIKSDERGGFTRPRVVFKKGSFYGKSEGELD